MDLTVNLAPSYRDLKDPTTRQNFDDTVEQKRVIDLRACPTRIYCRKSNFGYFPIEIPIKIRKKLLIPFSYIFSIKSTTPGYF